MSRRKRTLFFQHPCGVVIGLMPVQDEARKHGSHRWNQGYDLCELTREWGLLQLCLSDEIESFRRAHEELHPEEAADFMHGVRQALMRAVHDGIAESAQQYHDLQQREAAAKARELQTALAIRALLNGFIIGAHSL